MQSGEKADLFVNTWPAFRKELADAGMLRDLGPLWDSAKLGDNLSDSWKALGSTDGKLYGVTYTFGDRSAMFYKTDTMKKAGIDKQPTNWDEFVANFKKLNAAGVTPIAVGAKVWSHTEWFESIYEHLNGIDKAADLAAHKIPWTDEFGEKYAQEMGRTAEGRMLRRRQQHAGNGLGQRVGRAVQAGHVRLPDDRHVEQRPGPLGRRPQGRRRLFDPAVSRDGRRPRRRIVGRLRRNSPA